MDQLRKVGDWLRRHHFWVLTVIAILVALGCWWRGANALWAQYQENKSKIESGFSSAGTVRQKQFHANNQVQTAQNEQIRKQQESVNALWKVLYERQTAAVLKWPSNLSEEFRNYISKLNFGAEIPRNLRAHYNNYVRDHFPELPKIVGALEMPDSGPGGSSTGRGPGSFDVQGFLQNMRNSSSRGGLEEPGATFEEPEFLVVWADQQLIRDELAPRSTPSSKRIWKTQEDVWVYEALLTIIANTNEAAGADRFSNAAIRVIESLEVGRAAAQAGRGKGRIEIAAVAPAGDGMMMEGGGEMMDGGRGGMMPEMGMGMDGGGMMMEGMDGMMGRGMGMDGASSDTDLLNNRYVDENGAPIPDPGGSDMSAFGTEFKRLPVRMRLWMDQRWLPQLISECANAPLQVEVQEVRINPPDDGSGGYGRGGYGGRGDMGGYGSAVATNVEMAPEQEPNMKTVVLQGTVYIFNPPSTDAMQIAGDPALGDPGVQ